MLEPFFLLSIMPASIYCHTLGTESIHVAYVTGEIEWANETLPHGSSRYWWWQSKPSAATSTHINLKIILFQCIFYVLRLWKHFLCHHHVRASIAASIPAHNFIWGFFTLSRRPVGRRIHFHIPLHTYSLARSMRPGLWLSPKFERLILLSADCVCGVRASGDENTKDGCWNCGGEHIQIIEW